MVFFFFFFFFSPRGSSENYDEEETGNISLVSFPSCFKKKRNWVRVGGIVGQNLLAYNPTALFVNISVFEFLSLFSDTSLY